MARVKARHGVHVLPRVEQLAWRSQRRTVRLSPPSLLPTTAWSLSLSPEALRLLTRSSSTPAREAISAAMASMTAAGTTASSGKMAKTMKSAWRRRGGLRRRDRARRRASPHNTWIDERQQRRRQGQRWGGEGRDEVKMPTGRGGGGGICVSMDLCEHGLHDSPRLPLAAPSRRPVARRRRRIPGWSYSS